MLDSFGVAKRRLETEQRGVEEVRQLLDSHHQRVGLIFRTKRQCLVVVGSPNEIVAP
jgi:deoxyinosine 3'endonuclease (endonuclease V)